LNDLELPSSEIPKHGVMITGSGEFATGLNWQIVDFDAGDATKIRTTFSRDSTGKYRGYSVESKRVISLTKLQLAKVESIANAIWRGKRVRQLSMCPGSFGELILLDGNRVFNDYRFCPFGDLPPVGPDDDLANLIDVILGPKTE
jgi:hypothetical protein